MLENGGIDPINHIARFTACEERIVTLRDQIVAPDASPARTHPHLPDFPI